MEPFSVLLAINSYDNAEYLTESLASIMEQTLLPAEIILVVNGSLPSLLEEAIESFRRQHPFLLIPIPLEEPFSLGAALAIGVRNCKAEYVMRIEPGDLAVPQRFAWQMEEITGNRELVIVGGRVRAFIQSPEDYSAEYSVLLEDEEIRKFSKKRNPFHHTTVCFHKGAAINAGNYEEMPWFEDYWLWVRLLKQGRGQNLDQVLTYARGGNRRIAQRGGWQVAKDSVTFQKRLWKAEHISTSRFLTQSAIRVLEAFLPRPLRVMVYEKRLKNDEKRKVYLVNAETSDTMEVIKMEEGGLTMPIIEKSDEFLKKYGMHHDSLDMKKEVAVYQSEMEKGLVGKESSTLMMLPTFIAVSEGVPFDTPIIVVDAGGTNFRVAVVTFRQGKLPLIEQFKMYKMPGTQGTIDRQEFFDTIAERLLPVINYSDTIGFCFSYPTTILPNKDGRFISFSKEVSVTGMEGAVLGEEINKSLAKHEVSAKKFLILNDTVAAMLGGMGGDDASQVDGYIGFILGTGTNTCYAEKTSNILKNPDAMAQGGEMAINVESGGYGQFPRGVLDERYDATTKNPGQYQFEKMVSGAYQGGVLYVTAKQAIEDGLFSEEFAKSFPIDKEVIPLWEVDTFLNSPIGDNPLADMCHNEDDRQMLAALFTASYERAAKLVAISLAATMMKMGRGSDVNKPVCIVAEGTTFQKSRVFREKLDEQVASFMNVELGIYCHFHKVEDATLLGTAVAGLIG